MPAPTDASTDATSDARSSIDVHAATDADRSVDAVLFDLDGTLVEYERPAGELLARSFEAAGVDPFFEFQAYLDRFDDHMGPGVSITEGRANCFAAIAEECGRDPEDARAVAAAYREERDHSRVRTLPGAADVVESLAADHALGVITNGPPDAQTAKLEASGLADRFETAVFAGYDTAAKPDPEPFEVALDALGSRPERAVFVGNSLSADVAGAHAAGLRSVWYPAEADVEPDPEPHFAFESLAALADRPWLAASE
ncbi:MULTISPECIES: HAD family hydrolase [Halorussus]|uniref:HAD family hydrolase n=1 Tax=Halorussus TaxID=1070314 RepID=UPI00209F7F92|nr:HAD family hydrolase [Halorussus vallis]USZ77120.1 HAD family hydrolase [Halorussus vallis]